MRGRATVQLPMNTNKIERSIELQAPVSRVWRALTDYREFGTWFRARLETSFEPGKTVHGQMTYPGYEHIPFEASVLKMEPERLFSFTWPPYSEDPQVDVSKEPPTTVEFRLEPTTTGTRLTVTETGFEKLSPRLRAEAFRGNEQGWAEQMKNIERHVAAT